jgi:hypothetical protein
MRRITAGEFLADVFAMFGYAPLSVYCGNLFSASAMPSYAGRSPAPFAGADYPAGAALEETAKFIWRARTPMDVARKAKELGLKWQMGA